MKQIKKEEIIFLKAQKDWIEAGKPLGGIFMAALMRARQRLEVLYSKPCPPNHIDE